MTDSTDTSALTSEAFTFLPPRTGETAITSAIVVDSPHSGRSYPDDFDYACPLHDLRGAEDLLLDQILIDLPDQGVPVLLAEFPRSYIDVNRALDDIDPLILSAPWTASAIAPDGRSALGIGLVRRLLAPGVPLYNRLLTPEEVERRIESCYRPYHAALSHIINETHARRGQVLHLNMHSMSPSVFGETPALRAAREKDIVIGDLNGLSCAPALTRFVGDLFEARGYRVGYNTPYRGAEILKRYGRPSIGYHSLQIEINKSSYIFEKSIQLKHNARKIRQDLGEIIKDLQLEFLDEENGANPIAAE